MAASTVSTVVRDGNHPTATRSERYRRWVAATTLGELAGFAVPAVVGTVVTAAGLSQALTVLALVLAGTGEGAVLGWAQSRALRHDLPGLRPRDWVAATAAGAAVAWLLGMLPSSFYGTLSGWPPAALAAAGLVAGTALLTTIGGAQWLVLRHHVERAGVWVPANALAWVAGLAVVSAAMAMAPGRPVLVALAGILGGLGMGLTVALVTGGFLVRLLERPAHRTRGG
jgi:hypothetical protein